MLIECRTNVMSYIYSINDPAFNVFFFWKLFSLTFDGEFESLTITGSPLKAKRTPSKFEKSTKPRKSLYMVNLASWEVMLPTNLFSFSVFRMDQRDLFHRYWNLLQTDLYLNQEIFLQWNGLVPIKSTKDLAVAHWKKWFGVRTKRRKSPKALKVEYLNNV